MIEFRRYARNKSQGLVSAYAVGEGQVQVDFKRFDPENGKEVDPEVCLVTFEELEAKQAELVLALAVVKELLKLKPPG